MLKEISQTRFQGILSSKTQSHAAIGSYFYLSYSAMILDRDLFLLLLLLHLFQVNVRISID